MLVAPAATLRLFAAACRGGVRRGVPERSVLAAAHDIGNRAAPLVLGGMAFFGAVMTAHGASQARKVVQDLAVVGPAFFELTVRELGPTIAGILAAVRAGAAIAAELAAMKVTEQLDALRMSAGDPEADLVFPRLLGGVIALPCLLLVATALCATVAAAVATLAYGADGRAFLDASFIDAGDLVALGAKVLLYGLTIPLAACHAGLSARGGPAAVGEATSRGVVAACMMVLFSDLAVSAALAVVGL